MMQQEKLLRVAFAAGAVADTLAIVLLLVPSLAKFMWGFEDPSGAYYFAMGYAASLMLGWTGYSFGHTNVQSKDDSWPSSPFS